jgi:hypothetical protein
MDLVIASCKTFKRACKRPDRTPESPCKLPVKFQAASAERRLNPLLYQTDKPRRPSHLSDHTGEKRLSLVRAVPLSPDHEDEARRGAERNFPNRADGDGGSQAGRARLSLTRIEAKLTVSPATHLDSVPRWLPAEKISQRTEISRKFGRSAVPNEMQTARIPANSSLSRSNYRSLSKVWD